MIFYITLTGPKDNNQSVKEVSLQKRGGTQWGNESANQRIKCNWLDSQVINPFITMLDGLCMKRHLSVDFSTGMSCRPSLLSKL